MAENSWNVHFTASSVSVQLHIINLVKYYNKNARLIQKNEIKPWLNIKGCRISQFTMKNNQTFIFKFRSHKSVESFELLR